MAALGAGVCAADEAQHGPVLWAVRLSAGVEVVHAVKGMSVVGGTIPAMSPEALLEFESRWPRHTPDKTEAVRRELGITPIRFYQLLHRAVSSIDGIRADPITARLVRERIDRHNDARHRSTT